MLLLGLLAAAAAVVFLGGFHHPYLVYPVLAAAIIAGREATRQQMQRRTQLEIEERFRHLYGAAFDGIMVHDRERVLEANHAMAAMFGHSDDAILAVPLAELIDPASLRRLRRGAPGADEVVEVRAIRHGGGGFVAELTDRAVSLASGEIRVAALRDIGDRVTAERLRAMQFAVTRILADADTLDDAAPRVLETMATSPPARWSGTRRWDDLRAGPGTPRSTSSSTPPTGSAWVATSTGSAGAPPSRPPGASPPAARSSSTSAPARCSTRCTTSTGRRRHHRCGGDRRGPGDRGDRRHPPPSRGDPGTGIRVRPPGRPGGVGAGGVGLSMACRCGHAATRMTDWPPAGGSRRDAPGATSTIPRIPRERTHAATDTG